MTSLKGPVFIFQRNNCLHLKLNYVLSYKSGTNVQITSNKPEARIVSVKCERLGEIISTPPPPVQSLKDFGGLAKQLAETHLFTWVERRTVRV